MNSVEFLVVNDWGQGFTAEIVITNTGSVPLETWQLAFDAPFEITHLWNGELQTDDSGRYQVTSAHWNRSILPGQSVSFGFNGQNPSGVTIAPTNFSLNGESMLGGAETAPLPELTFAETSALEGNDAVFTLRLSAPAEQPVTVDFATQNGSAVAPADYLAQQGQLTFWPGETEKTVAIATQDDSWVEASETFSLKLTNPVGLTLVSEVAQATLLDDDLEPAPEPAPEPVPKADPPEADPPEAFNGPFNYGEALQKSFLFYEAQRSGALPADNRIAWRGDSALNDGAEVGVDLSGGYYDAGDHVKFGLPMASSMTLLSWGVNQYRQAYAEMGQLDEALAAIKWGTDYLLKAHVSAGGETQAFWGQVGLGGLDHSYWGAPETLTMERPAFAITPEQPGSDLAAGAAAAMAAASVVFRPSDAGYANQLLTEAEQLYRFADRYRGRYSEAIPDSAGFYNSWSGYQDELAWGAAWLHAAHEAKGSSDGTYLAKAEAEYAGISPGWTLSWDNKAYGTAVLLAQETGKARYRQEVETWLESWLPGGSVSYTEGGLAWLNQWGSLRYAANTAFLAGVYGDTVADPGGRYGAFADQQINYMLGDNPRQSSYVVGFGENYPLNPHHRGASGTTNEADPADNDYLLYGALVGGPKAADDYAYEDLRTDYIANEVALDYNAAFTGALARMAGRYGGDPLSDGELDLLPEIAIADVA